MLATAAGTRAAPARAALALRVEGIVQGVGFRPFVHRLASRLNLGGMVRNAATHVDIEVEGRSADVEAFAALLRAEAPPLARIGQIERISREPHGRRDFIIAPSFVQPAGGMPVSPDVALCRECERELFDPANRRYRYPFITCTDCGPRFSVIETMPYDRERTTMRSFSQCPECLREYRDPADRRHHSETNSCPACGPTVWLVNASGRPVVRGAAGAIAAAAALLATGRIVAVRGLGGFHLAVDATDEAAVRRLRERKHRDSKPLAVMVGSLEGARRLVHVHPDAAELLESAERPIVVLEVREGGPLARAVAPGLASAGIMLAYTPLHHLLLDAVRRPLVMTSGNRSEEPIAIGNDEALAALGGIADAFLLHDREIIARCDDSVIRAETLAPIVLRRARGYAPAPLELPIPARTPLVAVGPHLKNTLTLAHGDRAFVSQHVGDLEDLGSLASFRAVLERFRTLFGVEPGLAVRDLHPGYLSTRIAGELGLPVMVVQHHHAHLAAVMAEHGVTEPIVGVALDGTGWGDDACVWGAEIMVLDLTGYRRVTHLRYAPLPGGDLAARRPWRSALGYLSLAPELKNTFACALARVNEAERTVAERQIARALNAPRASSAGRLFDAAAALIGLRTSCDYEGQAAMELESLAGRTSGSVLAMPVIEEEGGRAFDPMPLLGALGERCAQGEDRSRLAADFHESLADAVAREAMRTLELEGLTSVALGGGCFQNARLLNSTVVRLTARGVRVLVPRRLPPNDGAVSYGQAAVAAARIAQGD